MAINVDSNSYDLIREIHYEIKTLDELLTILEHPNVDESVYEKVLDRVNLDNDNHIWDRKNKIAMKIIKDPRVTPNILKQVLYSKAIYSKELKLEIIKNENADESVLLAILTCSGMPQDFAIEKILEHPNFTYQVLLQAVWSVEELQSFLLIIYSPLVDDYVLDEIYSRIDFMFTGTERTLILKAIEQKRRILVLENNLKSKELQIISRKRKK